MAAKEYTTSYTWNDGGVIQRIDVRHQSNGRAVAYIYADNSPEKHQQRQDIRSAIRLEGWGTLSDHRDGIFALRVSGLKDGSELIDMLAKQGFVKGAPQLEQGSINDEKSKNALEFIRNNSLRISALAYTAGNIGYWLSGWTAKGVPSKSGRNEERMKMALAFGVGDAALGLFGGRDDARQYRSLVTELKKHMESSGIEIPSNASIYVETARFDRGIFSGMYELLHTHINSIKMLAEVAGGFFALRSGLKSKNKFEIGGGAVVMAGWAGALLTKEKKQDPEKMAAAGTLEKLGAWVQEKPTRLAGLAGFIFNGVSGYNFLTKLPSSEGKWGVGAVGTMVGANGLYAISHKSPGGDIKTQAMVSDVYSVAAQILNKQPDELREKAMESTARFLGERPEISDTHEQILVRLQREMDVQRQNPWFEQVGLAPYTPQPHHHGPQENSPGMDEAPPHAPVEDGESPKPVVEGKDLKHLGARVAAEPSSELQQA